MRTVMAENGEKTEDQDDSGFPTPQHYLLYRVFAGIWRADIGQLQQRLRGGL